MILKNIVLLFILVTLDGEAREIPNYIHICKRSDPSVAKCIRESVEVLRPRLKSGIPEINVPSLEPLHIDEIVIARGEDSNQFKAFLRNVVVHGAGDFVIKKLKLNVDKHTYRIGIEFPLLTLEGDYEVDARVLVVPIKGTGKFLANITNPEGQGVLKAEVFSKNGHREIRFSSFDFAIRMKDYTVHLDNLFNGDPILSQAANGVLNDNKDELLQRALPFVQAKTSEILLRAANRVTEDLDYDKVFPEK